MRILLILLIVTVLAADGRSDGRRGNEAFAEGDFQSAAEAYQEGLFSAGEDVNPQLRFGLTNNLGAAQYRLGSVEDALEAFASAAQVASEAGTRALADYNAGNAAFKTQDLQRALNHYKRALLANPDDPNAKFNYEFVKRQMQDQQDQQNQDQQQQGGDQEQDEQGEDDQQQNQDQNEGDEGDQQDQGQQDGENQDEQQGEDSENQDAGDQESDEGQQEQQQDGAPDQQPTDLTREQAERILQALENEEAELLREVQRMDSRPRRVEKDW